MLRKDLSANFLRWKRSLFAPRNQCFSVSFIQKVHTFPFEQSSCFCNNFFRFHKNLFLSIILKDLLNFHYKKKCEAELKNSLNFQWLNANFGNIRDPLKQNLALQFCRDQNKCVSILTETHINLDQIHHINNNSLHRKWSFPLSNSSLNVIKSAVSCTFGHIYWRNL